MTKRERTLASIRRKPLDAIPWQFDLTSVAAEKLRVYFGNDDLLTATGDHFVTAGFGSGHGTKQDDPGTGLWRNEFGTIWRAGARDSNVGDWGDLISYPLHEPSLAGYHFPDGTNPGRWDHIPTLRRQYPDHFLMAHGSGLFENAWGLCGFENYLSYILSDEDFVIEMTEHLADFSCAVTAQLADLGADGIRFGDDWGFQDKLMILPDVWRRIFKSQYRRIYQAAHDAGLVVMIHSCGNITDIVPDLIEIGVEVINAFQPEAMDVIYCQREFGSDVTFWGGLGSQSTIPLGTPVQVREEAVRMLDLFSEGGYILAPAGAVPTETPVENVAAIIEVAKAQLKKLRIEN
ncbi:MAG: uroporphyrinogen decarboxylase family protein [bacterium]